MIPLDEDRPDLDLRRGDIMVVSEPGWIDDGLYLFRFKTGLRWGGWGISRFDTRDMAGHPRAFPIADDLALKFRASDEGNTYQVFRIHSIIKNSKRAAHR
jgi:hypothetical protein